MNVVIPPLIFYSVGAMLVIFGGLRAFTLGRRRPERELRDDDNDARLGERRRHLRWGIIWMLLGLFLIFSTAGVLKMRAPF